MPTAPARRSTSSRRTPTARRRSTSGRCSRATGERARRSGGPSGASRRPTSTRSATRSSPGCSCCAGMASAMGRIEALSYWVVSDHFEELGRPPSLLHGGFGLRTVGELRKPRWWALAMLERLGPRQLSVVDVRRRWRVRWWRRWPPPTPSGRRVRAGLEPHPRPDQGGRLGAARSGRAGRAVRARAGGGVHAHARAGRRGPLQRRRCLGRAASGGSGLAGRHAVGRVARRRIGWTSWSRRGRWWPTRAAGRWWSSSCRCRL